MSDAAPVGSIEADYFDGRSARAHAVRLSIDGDQLLIAGDGVERRLPMRQVQWPERTRHGVRLAHLAGGGSLHGRDAAAWDAWRRDGGQRDSPAVAAQQSWRWVAASTLALLLALAALFVWGMPWAVRAVVAVTPLAVDEALGDAALRSLDEHLLRPSRLPPAEQARLRTAFERAVAAAAPPADAPSRRVVFRAGRIGANAFALPGGTIVMTDELVRRVDADAAIVTGVLAHELGHVRRRHGLRLLAQTSLLGLLSSALLGDASGMLATVPALLGRASYSRDAEREADGEAVRVLKAAGIAPTVMVTLFEKLAAGGDAPSWLGIAIASHPADAERIRFFRDAAAR